MSSPWPSTAVRARHISTRPIAHFSNTHTPQPRVSPRPLYTPACPLSNTYPDEMSDRLSHRMSCRTLTTHDRRAAMTEPLASTWLMRLLFRGGTPHTRRGARERSQKSDWLTPPNGNKVQGNRGPIGVTTPDVSVYNACEQHPSKHSPCHICRHRTHAAPTYQEKGGGTQLRPFGLAGLARWG